MAVVGFGDGYRTVHERGEQHGVILATEGTSGCACGEPHRAGRSTSSLEPRKPGLNSANTNHPAALGDCERILEFTDRPDVEAWAQEHWLTVHPWAERVRVVKVMR